MQQRKAFGRITPVALAAVLALPMFAQNKSASDAQVEADVLKAFAADARLATQPIKTSTVYGTVTLSGSVADEGARDAAEQIASRTSGVKKVVDQLTVGAAPAQAAGNDYDPAARNSLPGEGAAVSAAQGSATAAANQQQPGPENGNQAPGTQGSPQYAQQGQQTAQPGQYPPQGQYGQPEYGQQPQYGQQSPYGQAQGSYAPNGNYPPPPPPQRRLYRRDYERQMAGGQQDAGSQQQYAQGGQPGGQLVTIPNGTVLAVRINRWLSSDDAAPGSQFTAIVSEDVIAGGQIAIPRGATVDGTVLDAKGAGVLKGRGSLTLQLNTLLLGGRRIPLQCEPFTVNGRDKTAQSVNSTLIGAGVGALLGAAIGRGTGAAIGAGVGGAAGLGTSAASNRGQAVIPSEALLRFRLTAPAEVATVSEAEMQRLGGYAGPAAAYRNGPPQGYGRPYPVGVYAAPYPYPYYGRYYRGGYWY